MRIGINLVMIMLVCMAIVIALSKSAMAEADKVVISKSASASAPASAVAPQYELSITAKSLTADQKEALNLFARLPMQNGGRIKPIDSFARETILFEAGSRRMSTISDWDAQYSALLVLRDWLMNTQAWAQREFIPIRKSSIICFCGKFFYILII